MVFPLLQIFLGRENWKWKEIRFAEMRMRMRMKSKERWAARPIDGVLSVEKHEKSSDTE
jgi:hypothetical protein